MRSLPPRDGLSPLTLLTRGPDYLRKQLEVSSGGRTPSAVERLEADKVKYVKSRQVISCRQEPALLSFAPRSSPCCRRPLTLHQQSEFPQGLTVSQDDLSSKKPPPSPQSPIARRGGGRRLLRPDSLVIYRQKRDCSAHVNEETSKAYSLMKWLFQGPLKEGHHSYSSSRNLLGDGHLEVTQEETSMVWVPMEKEDMRPVPSVGIVAGFVGYESEPSQKSQASYPLNMDQTSPPPSDSCPTETKKELTQSYSLPLSEKERFFNYCGLDRKLVEVLGTERFKPGCWEARSSCIGSASSECGGPSSNGEKLSAEEASGKLPVSVSVVERNARVIKWLYSCQQAHTISKESTV